MRIQGRTLGGIYFHFADNDFEPLKWESPSILFSFAGSIANHPVRQSLLKKLGSHTSFVDSSGSVIPAFTKGDTKAIAALRHQMIELARKSKFVLCPRGKGCGSIRLFEVMQMARCPVIISDEWMPPNGPEWESFSIRIPENDIATIPDVLKGLEHKAEKLGRLSRDAYDRFFASEMRLSWIAHELRQLLAPGAGAILRHRLMLVRLLTEPFYIRMVLRSLRRR
jgi:hypothetical protein